jgi:hypothetical protein
VVDLLAQRLPPRRGKNYIQYRGTEDVDGSIQKRQLQSTRMKCTVA